MAGWNGGAENYPDAASYCRACLVDNNAPGAEKVKGECHLPVRDPGGGLNRTGMAAAAAALAGARGGYQGPDKKAAARKLLSLYRSEKMDPPPSLKNMGS